MVSSLENEHLPSTLLHRDIIFFDGNCVLCHNMVRFVLKVDKRKHFLLCSQQSETGHLVLERHGKSADDLKTIYVVTDCGSPQENVLERSSASLYVMSRAGGMLAFLSKILRMIPAPLRDFAYNCVANNRYRVFGSTSEACSIASETDRQRIIG